MAIYGRPRSGMGKRGERESEGYFVCALDATHSRSRTCSQSAGIADLMSRRVSSQRAADEHRRRVTLSQNIMPAKTETAEKMAQSGDRLADEMPQSMPGRARPAELEAASQRPRSETRARIENRPI